MNFHYPTHEAVAWLNGYIESSKQVESDDGAVLIDALNIESCTPAQFTEPPCIRLTVPGGDERVAEATVRLPGILCYKTLPPISAPLRSTSVDHVRYLRQFVRITGLDSDTFRQWGPVFEDVESTFSTLDAVSAVDGFEFGLYEGMYSVDLHARYLTERRYVTSQVPIPFPPDVDPHHYLEDARGHRFVRVQDNVVQYSKKILGKDGKYYHERLSPSEFKEGDIVEVTGVFIGYPTSEKGRYKLVFVLRSLSLLNSSFRERSYAQKRPRSGSHENHRKRHAKKAKLPTSTQLIRSMIFYDRRDGAGDVEMTGALSRM